MSDASKPKPAREPIEAKGNWFWRDGERFLIKGINYFLREGQDGTLAAPRDPRIDPLTDEHLDELRRDIQFFRELGLNAITVLSLDPTKSHHAALDLLAEAGIYVLVTVGEDIKPPERPQSTDRSFDQHFDTTPFYTPELITRNLQLVDQLADHPNVLGFVVSGNSIVLQSNTKIAEVVRALLRDVKTFLRLRGGRKIPVGVHLKELVMLRKSALQYFTAGDRETRADFFAPEVWSWAYKSSFQISGWKNLVATLGAVPVPMFLSAYGAQVGKNRIWEEVLCLYSPDMTDVFSGGSLYTLHEYGDNYGLVRMDGERVLQKKDEYATLKKRMNVVAGRRQEEIWRGELKDYEDWIGGFPETLENRWAATSTLPDLPLDWDQFLKDLGHEKERDSSERAHQSVKLLSDQIADLSIKDHEPQRTQ